MRSDVQPIEPTEVLTQLLTDKTDRHMGVQRLNHAQIDGRAQEVAALIKKRFTPEDDSLLPNPVYLYPVPRGGVPALYAILRHLPKRFQPCMSPQYAHATVDDLIDSGKTWERFETAYPDRPFYTLYNKINEAGLGWLVFPWEGTEEASIEDNVRRLIQYVGEDPEREGLRETPQRVARAWRDWTCGYSQNPKEVLKTFETDGKYDEMVVVRGLWFYSMCEHHMAPFFGTADIAYVPNGKIVGLSKLSRVLEVFARRLQVQERMTVEIAEALMENLHPKGAAVRVTAQHLCMESRGINKPGSKTVTQALRGVFYDDARTRAEFMQQVK